ncbi:tRNA lysidine(34) synthetase TilS [Pseudochrobactrum sp. HB0163]|uniref:tRNA lysidine(34) synthetase TilS n=1 Tax=Pseudochrobactrum sp. HB0163 TaxID=3450708 RepID=UPI003F6E1C74
MSGFSTIENIDADESIFAGFDACWPEPAPHVVVVAISGGSDSVALLLLAQIYLARKSPESKLLAVTIDHQLRAESAAEASAVGQLCSRLNIEHQILSWEGEKPASGIAAAARTARYALLVHAARQVGASVILSGHTADDQVETYLMRQKRLNRQCHIAGAGRGLAVMAPQTLLQDSVLLCRPLLKTGRETLRQFLRARNIGWVDDPSNMNQAYERPRTRTAAQFADKAAILQKIHQYAGQRLEDNHKVAALMCQNRAYFQPLANGGLLLRDGWNAQYTAYASLALAYLLAAIGGRSFLPAISDCAQLLQSLPAMQAGGGGSRTLHHCVIERVQGAIMIRRERRNLPEMAVAAGQGIIWDGRYSVINKTTLTLTIASVNMRQLSDFLRCHDRAKLPASLPARREELLVLPAVFVDNLCMAIPALSGLADQNSIVSVKPYFACFDHVLSGYDFEVARVVKAFLTMPLDHKIM